MAIGRLDLAQEAPSTSRASLTLRAEDRVLRPQWQRRWRRFAQNRLSLLGAAIIVVLALMAAVGPMLTPYPKDASRAVHIGDRLQPPSPTHWMGTDDVGRDVFTRLVVGSRLSLGAGFVILLSASIVGMTMGIVSGYAGGRVDTIMQRITDIFLTTPDLILAMAVTAALGPSLLNVVWALSLVWWPGYCRLTRGEVLRAKEEAYVEAARSIGAPSHRLLLRHIVPNILTPTLVKASMDIGFAVLSLAALGFIGLGAQPPTPDWGKMISDGRQFLPESWWITLFPGIAIFLTVFGFNILGDGIRDVFDPRSRD
jgi:peptide/nickel transport system permease protein